MVTNKEEHLLIKNLASKFSDENIRPYVEEWDMNEIFPSELYQKMGDIGLFGIMVPEELGGCGFDCKAYAIVMEELSKGYSSVADQCGLVELLSNILVHHGTDNQRKLWLEDLIKSKKKGAYCITEAEAGSDVSNIKTTAEKTNDGWVLSGNKLWIHNAPVSDVAFVLARTNPEAGKRGMSIFIVDCGLEGVKKGTNEHKMGQRSSKVGELCFNNVVLDDESLIGQEGRGFHIMMSVLDKGRVGIAALAIGIAQAGLEASINQVKIRSQFGKKISEFQAIQFLLADMAKDIEAGRLLTHSAAEKIDNNADASATCSMAKCFSSDIAVEHTSNAIQIFGGTGYIKGFEVERLYRDAKITQIYEGTNQIQRIIIARKLLDE
jgi:hypothetical protein|tara:strand:+ start:296 stop:1432 length:1137 start_codon:yes stop_codon:yes gene_type:complete